MNKLPYEGGTFFFQLSNIKIETQRKYASFSRSQGWEMAKSGLEVCVTQSSPRAVDSGPSDKVHEMSASISLLIRRGWLFTPQV